MPQLSLDAFPATLEDVHRHLRFVAVLQSYGGSLYACDLVGW